MRYFLEVVMTRHRVPFATLFVQPHPQPAVLRVNILDCHSERRADPGEGIDHQPDEGAIAQTGSVVTSMPSSTARFSRRAPVFAPTSQRGEAPAPSWLA
jgi:hypothetical protein